MRSLSFPKRIVAIFLLAIPFHGALPMDAAAPELKKVREIQREAAKETFRESRVRIDGIVTWINYAMPSQFFLQDETGGTRVTSNQSIKLRLGEIVEADGLLTRGAFSPAVTDAKVLSLGQSQLPPAKTASGGGLLNGAYNGERVQVEGWVRSAKRLDDGTVTAILSSGSARVTVRISDAEGLVPEEMIATQIRVQGVASPVKARGSLRQLVDVEILVARKSDVHFASAQPPDDPWQSEIVPLKGAFQYRPGQMRGDRIRVKGQIIEIRGGMIYLNDGDSGLAVRSDSADRFQAGQWVEAVGFLDLEEHLPVLSDAILLRVPSEKPDVMPHEALPEKILSDGLRHADYISIAGKLLDRMEFVDPGSKPSGALLTLALQTDRRVFIAELAQSNARKSMPNAEPGSTLKVSGICLVQTDSSGNPIGFRILIPAANDITVVQPASFFTVKRLFIVLSIVLAVLLVVAQLAYFLARRNMGLIAEMRERYAVAAERTRLARDLHDTLEQGLTGIHLLLHSIGGAQETAPAEIRKRLGTVQTMVSQCHAEIRRSIWALRAGALEHFDLAEALKRSASELAEETNIRVEVRTNQTSVKPPPLIEDNLLRIGQEALTNAIKHSHASLIRIVLEIRPTGASLSISDDGGGFDPSGIQEGHFGLVGMRERASRMGGQLNISSQPGAGSTIRVEVPFT